MFAVLVVVVGVLWLLYNIFVNTGGSPKFKSDLPSTDQTKKRGKFKWFIILSLICLAALCLLLIVLSLIL